MYSLILVDYNSLNATVNYIRSCRNCLGISGTGHIVIVENGSGEGDVDLLQQAFGTYEILNADGISQTLYSFRWEECQIVYCHSGGNLGYAKGNNLGTEIAQKLWADPYYIISNNDLEFPATFDLDIAGKLFESNPKIGAIGPQIITPEGICQSPHRWISAYRRLIVFIWLCSIANFVSPQRYNQLKEKYCNDLDIDAPTGPCGWVSGCFCILRSSAFHKAGMYDPHTFLYAEEPILSRRLEKAGFETWFCRELDLVHRHGQTTKSAMSRLKIFAMDFQSMHYYYRTYTDTSAIVLLLAKWNFALYKGMHTFWNFLKSLKKGGKESV